MTKIYIDFDGVILDTWKIISDEYIIRYKNNNYEDYKIKKVMNDIGWKYILEKSEIINNNIDNIKKLSKKVDVIIITKINSKDEQLQKEQYLRKYGLKTIIFVPYECKKSESVIVNNDILIDDDLGNLDDWHELGGISIFFNRKMENIDSYGKKNTNYKIIDNINCIYDIIKSEQG